jgi:hypothetical protein
LTPALHPLDIYVGERDLLGMGFSDNVIFRKQYYVRALLDQQPLKLYLHADERFAAPAFVPSSTRDAGYRRRVAVRSEGHRIRGDVPY